MEEVKIEIPDGVDVVLEGMTLTVTGGKGTVTKSFRAPSVHVNVSERVITVSTPSHRKKDVATMGTIRSHIKNMLCGVETGYEYKLKIYYAHFPMNVSVGEGRVKIDNFLGEKYPRYAPIVGDTQVKITGDEITVSGIDKGSVGQTAANLEQATRIRRKDPRVFQDGIYLFEKDGVRVK